MTRNKFIMGVKNHKDKSLLNDLIALHNTEPDKGAIRLTRNAYTVMQTERTLNNKNHFS